MESESEKRSQSEFNMAVSYLNRLNVLFYLCNDAAIQLDSYSWFHSLMALFRELSTEMNKDITKLNVSVNKNMGNIRRKGVISIESELYQQLHEFEMKLRKILKDAGLQTKIMEDARKALR